MTSIENNPASSSLRFHIDSPGKDGAHSRHVELIGWCFDANGKEVKTIRARVGRKRFRVKRKQSRPDVAQWHPDFPQAFSSGFRATIKLPRGRSMLVVEVDDERGEWIEIARVQCETPFFEWPWKRLSAKGSRNDYARWIRLYDTLSDEDRKTIRADIASFSRQPLLSIIMPTFNSPARWLRRAIESLHEQLYENWELCIADDASSQPQVREIISEWQRRDPKRIKAVFRAERGNISIASNSALELACGEFSVLLDHDDEMPEHSLYWIAREIIEAPETDILYSDEDKIDERGKRFEPFFKPDYDPDLMMSRNFVCHVTAFRTSLFRDKMHGLRGGFEGSQDWDAVLRTTEQTSAKKIRHIPRVLYHWRAIHGSVAQTNKHKPYVVSAGWKAVESHLACVAPRAKLVEDRLSRWRVRWPLPEMLPRVTIIVPVTQQTDFTTLEKCAARLLGLTTYSNYELVFVTNRAKDFAASDRFSFLENIPHRDKARVLEASTDFAVSIDHRAKPHEMNVSAMMNFAAAQSSCDVLALLHDDIEIITPDWLEEMAAHALRADVGAVGAKLFYPNRIVQHAGHVLGFGGAVGHFYEHATMNYRGPRHTANLVRTVSSVSAACMVVRRELFMKADGFDEGNFPLEFADVDFCLRLSQRQGLRQIVTPFAPMIHHGLLPRGSASDLETATQTEASLEMSKLRERWAELLKNDPFYNPNLSLQRGLYALAFPPRVSRARSIKPGCER